MKWACDVGLTRREKVKQARQANVMEDLLDLDFSGFGPEKVRMDDGWNAPNETLLGERKREKKMEQRRANPPSLFSPPQSAVPTVPAAPAAPGFAPQPYAPMQPPFTPMRPQLPPRTDGLLYGGVPSYPPMDYYPPYPPYPQQAPGTPAGQAPQSYSMDFMMSSTPSSDLRSSIPPPEPFLNMSPSFMPPQNMPQNMPPQGMPPQGMPPQGMAQGGPQNMPPQGMPPQGMPQGMPQSMAQGMPQSMQQGGPQGMPQSMAQGMQQSMPQGMPQGMPQSMPPQSMPQNMPQNMPQGFMNPSLMPQNMPQGMPQNMLPQNVMVPQNMPPSMPQQPFVPLTPTLTAVKPAQPPSVLGQTHVESPSAVIRRDSSKTTIIPLMNPARDAPQLPPPQTRHQRGLSSVVHNTGLVEDESTEDEDDYESQIEKNERKTDENVKRKVMNALQSALSDLQLTGIQIKWSDIEVDRRIGVGGFAIVYHGLYRCV